MEQQALVEKLHQHRIRLNKEREIEEERKNLKQTVTDKALVNRIDKIEKEISHRDLMDKEFRAALQEAVLKREEAKYRDLIDAADKMKKQLNVIDGVGQEQVGLVMWMPTALLQRDAPHMLEEQPPIEAELVDPTPPPISPTPTIKRGRPKKQT